MQKYLAAPTFPADDEKTRIAALLNVILLMFIVMSLTFVLLGPFLSSDPFTSLGVLVGTVLVRNGLMSMMRCGRVVMASLFFLMMLWVVSTVLMLLSGGMNGPHMVTYITTVLVAGLLLGSVWGIVFSLFSALFGLLIAFLNMYAVLPETVLSNNTPLNTWLVLAANLVVVAMFQFLALNSLKHALARARHLAWVAQEANDYKSRLIARVSHELRSPLGAVLGLADMLHYGALGDLTVEQQGALQKIVVNATYLQRLVGELLDQSRIEVGQLKVAQEAFSPDALVQQVQSSLAEEARSKGLFLQTELAKELPPTLYGDFNHCSQVLVNLVGNAIQFTESGGVTVRIFLPDENHWAMQVRDTGIGIAPDVQSKIYEPFWQANQSSVRKRGGMGLGLSIVAQYVTLMQGQVELASEVGRGSTFTVILPLHRKEMENETVSLGY
ncbi:MAG: sensor histidine kinase [Chloroflexota bacterium]